MRNAQALFAGIDLGTSGVRGVCIDQHLATIASSAVQFSKADHDRRNPAHWWRAVQQVISGLLEQVDAASIGAIAIDGTSGTLLAVDGSGVPLDGALLYNDACTDEGILQPIRRHAPETSAVHGAASGLARAIALTTRHADASIVHEADWISSQLSGVIGISDENNALKTGYDPISRQWPEWIELTGMNRQKLPKVIAAGATIGTVSKSAARRTGLHPDTLVVAGTTDGCASFLATGAALPGDGVTVLGSTLTIKLLSNRPVYAPEYGIYSHRLGNRWLAGGASNTGGNVLAEYFTSDEIKSLSASINPEQDSHLDYYPLKSPGERFPVNDSHLQPRLDPKPADDAQFLHGVLQGIARIENIAYQRLHELGTPALTSVRTVGGGASNQTWTTIRKRMLNVEFLTSVSDQAAVGTATLARDGYRESTA